MRCIRCYPRFACPPRRSASRSRAVAWRLQSALSLLLVLLALAPRALAAERVPPPSDRTVILISLDGVRPADLNVEDVPSLLALAARGARADALEPPFPSNTFPGHVSMATGVAPERHGIVNNDFEDPLRGAFDRDDTASFLEVEPLWSLLARAGMPTASFYWVGSEGPWAGGPGPRFWKPFSARTRETTKVEQILRWLDLRDPAERPRLITSWFHGADHAAHEDGPGSDSARALLRAQDPAIGRLVAGVRERGLLARTTLIFVSDHGMVERGRDADLRGALRRAGVEARVYGMGGFASVVLADPDADAARVIALARDLGLDARRREGAPVAWRVGHPRFGHVVVRAPAGVCITPARDTGLRGVHGYAPELVDMGGVLIAAGPGIAPGTRLGRVRAVDVAPTVLAILGVAVPAWMEGRPIAALVPELAQVAEPATLPREAVVAPTRDR